MTPREVSDLVTFLATGLGRPEPEGARASWALVMADVPWEYARRAALEHLKTSPHWPAPADVIRLAREIAARERQKSAHRLALERAREEERRAVPVTQGARMVAWVVAESRRRLKGVVDRDKRAEVVSEIVAEWRARHPSRAGVAPRAVPCANPGCRCTHTDGCVAGWTVVVKPDGTEQAGACPNCHWRRYTILASGEPRAVALARLRNTSADPEEEDQW